MTIILLTHICVTRPQWVNNTDGILWHRIMSEWRYLFCCNAGKSTMIKVLNWKDQQAFHNVVAVVPLAYGRKPTHCSRHGSWQMNLAWILQLSTFAVLMLFYETWIYLHFSIIRQNMTVNTMVIKDEIWQHKEPQLLQQWKWTIVVTDYAGFNTRTVKRCRNVIFVFSARET